MHSTLVRATSICWCCLEVKVHPPPTYAFSENYIQSTCSYSWHLLTKCHLVKFLYIFVNSSHVSRWNKWAPHHMFYQKWNTTYAFSEIIFKAPVHDIFWKSSIFALILAFDVWIKRAKVKVHPFSTYAFSENHMQSTCGYSWDLVKFTRYICVDSRTINELLTACFHEKLKINQKISNLSYCWLFVIIFFSQNNLIG